MTSVSSPTIPPAYTLLWPTLRAIRDIGGSGTIEECNDKVIELEGFTEEQQAVPHGDGGRTEIEYRLAWVRTYLKGIGAVTNSARGVWSLTDLGRTIPDAAAVDRLRAEYTKGLREARQARRRRQPTDDDDSTLPDGEGNEDWRDTLLESLLAMEPDKFERLSQRLLREAGFVNATVTGRTGDGGIDGIGVYRLSLVSFQVFFQCKRYRGSVRAGAVRDFRGAMAGRGDKGLLITTGTFTAESKQESTRDGAPPIDLIDGERLCELLKEHSLGVKTEIKTIEQVSVDREFFSSF
jgi:restriction system protein